MIPLQDAEFLYSRVSHPFAPIPDVQWSFHHDANKFNGSSGSFAKSDGSKTL